MNDHLDDRRVEAPRDQNESEFTPILRRLWETDPSVLAVVFVDCEGECVDYCSSLDIFDTKVVGAQMLVTMTEFVGATLPFGAPYSLHVVSDRRDIWVRRVTDDYSLVVVVRADLRAGFDPKGLDSTAASLRLEGGLSVPAWEPDVEWLDVALRQSVGWDYAPLSFERGGETVEVAAVMGRWRDGEMVCFRVRTGGGEELTLAHHTRAGRWTVLEGEEPAAGG